MKKNSLSSQGLSLSQAQSVSNLCNQRAIEIAARFTTVNNYSKTVTIYTSTGSKTVTTVAGKKLPVDTIALIMEKAGLHACQAFLMENIKAKDQMLNEIKKAVADISSVVFPEIYKTVNPVILPEVQESFGWEQLTPAELNEYTEAEAFAAHIGQFIHKDGILMGLRRELPEIPSVEWMAIKDGEKSPVDITVHHTSEDLMVLHEELAALHRKYEQRVNYYKSRVKNITTEENARIAKVNADAQAQAAKANSDAQITYQTAYKAASDAVQTIRMEFEKERQARIKEIAAMRISVDQRFQPIIDGFLKQIDNIQE